MLKENSDENIFYAIYGINKEKKRALLICTNKRLVMFESGLFFGFTKTDFSFNKISAISSKKSFMSGELQFRVGGQNIVIEGLEKSLLEPFVDTVNKGMNNLYDKGKKANKSALNKQKDQPKLDVVDEIRRYKELLDEGILTEEEFEKKNGTFP